MLRTHILCANLRCSSDVWIELFLIKIFGLLGMCRNHTILCRYRIYSHFVDKLYAHSVYRDVTPTISMARRANTTDHGLSCWLMAKAGEANKLVHSPVKSGNVNKSQAE